MFPIAFEDLCDSERVWTEASTNLIGNGEWVKIARSLGQWSKTVLPQRFRCSYDLVSIDSLCNATDHSAHHCDVRIAVIGEQPGSTSPSGMRWR